MASHRRKQESGNDSGEAMMSGNGPESQSGYGSEESSLEPIGRERMSGRDDGDGMR